MKILIIDHQKRARQSLAALLSAYPPVEQVWERDNSNDALNCIEQARPDIILMDVHRLEMNGLEVTRQIKACWPQFKVVILAMYNDYAVEALAAGADAFISKGEPPEKLLAILSQLAVEQQESQGELGKGLTR